eukprot:3956752-Pleurochrysis_carterae.AAC.2
MEKRRRRRGDCVGSARKGRARGELGVGSSLVDAEDDRQRSQTELRVPLDRLEIVHDGDACVARAVRHSKGLSQTRMCASDPHTSNGEETADAQSCERVRVLARARECVCARA